MFVMPTLADFGQAYRLSPAEQRILGMVLEARTNKEVAAAVGTTEQVVKNLLNRVYVKLSIAGEIRNKRVLLMLMVSGWVKVEKQRRAKVQMDV